VDAPSAEMKIAYDLKILQGHTRRAYLLLAFRIQISGHFKIFDYWTNLSYPFYFYFVTISEQNILF
jgi:hypothetical protein